ncbi:MAG: NAD-dependent epimerase/dehydratase family protein [Candidatus Pacearchaeota archaeon]
MKCLVTGGAGFIGSHLVDYLINEGHEVTIIDDLSGGLEDNVNSKAKFVKGSIVDKNLVEELVSKNEIIYHLAAYAAEGLSHFVRRYNYMNNLIGSVNLINAAIKYNVKHFVFTSSMAVYGEGTPPFKEEDKPNPDDPYGVAKYSTEMDLKLAKKMFGLNYTIIRPHNIYGERQFLGDPYRNVIGIWMNRIMQNKEPLIYGDGEQTRAFSYVGDIIHCIAKAPFVEEANGEIINLGAERPYTLNELAKEVCDVMNTNLKPIHTQERKEVKHAYCTIDKSVRLLGYEDKTPLKEGLQKMAEWAIKRGPMQPIIWENYELEKELPPFWKELKNNFPKSENRINPERF